MIYLFPTIRVKTIDDKYLSSIYFKESTDIKELSEIYLQDNLIVIAEPGNGKSRFLKEIVIKAPENNKEAIFLDLKKIKEKSIEETIFLYQKKDFNLEILLHNPEKINETKDYIRTQNFILKNIPNLIICLDALDEVKREYQQEYLEKIISFKTTYPDIQIIISARSYIWEDSNLKNLFNKISSNILEVQPFHNGHINFYLFRSGFEEDEILRFWNKFHLFSNDVIYSPRILEIFILEAKQNGLENTLNKTKAELIDTFVYRKLRIENEKTAINDIHLTERILEKLALVMEIYQTNQITKDELMSFFDDIQSGLSGGFLQNISIESFYDRSLLIPFENSIQFQNSEFQEYLAAKELNRLEKIEQIVFDLVIDKELNQFHPSWYNTLKYLVELKPELQAKMVDYIYQRQNLGEANLFDYILSSSPEKINRINEEIKGKIFKQVLEYHQKLHLSFFLAPKLYMITEFITPSIEKYLKEEIDKIGFDNDEIKNILVIISTALFKEKLKDKEYWKDKAIQIADNEDKRPYILEEALEIISLSKDIDLLKPYKDKSRKLDIYGRYVRLCQKTNPNAEYTIDLVLESLELGVFRRSIPTPDFSQVTNIKSLKYLLNKIKDTQYLARELDSEFNNDEFGIITTNLDKMYDKEIESIIKEILSNKIIAQEVNYNIFVKNLVLLVKKHNNQYIYELLDQLNDANFDEKYYETFILIKYLITPEQTKDFIEKISKFSDDKRKDIAIHIIFKHFKYSEDNFEREIYEISKQYFEAHYKKIEEETQEYNKKWNNKLQLYEEFILELGPIPNEDNDTHFASVFSFYETNKQYIIKYAKEGDYERLKYLIDKYFENNDFQDVKMSKKRSSENTFSITTSNIVPIIGSIIRILNDDILNINYQKYRQKILDFSPFFFSNKSSLEIFELIPDITEAEEERILSFYNQEREDDTISLNISNFFSAIEQYNIKKADTILKKVVLDEHKQFEAYIKREALDLLNKIKPDYKFYKLVFDRFKDNDSDSLAVKVNNFLITQENEYQDEAVSWRIGQLKMRVISLKTNKDYLDWHEIAFQTEHFNKPLLVLNYTKYQDVFLDLLEHSIENIYKLGKDNESYACYIWETVFAYFKNVKIHKSLSLLNKIEDFLKKYVDKFSGYATLNNYYHNLKVEYLIAIQKPDSIIKCVRKYNELKLKDYIKISSTDDLLYLVIDVIEKDIKQWVEEEGSYDFLKTDTYYKKTKSGKTSPNPKSNIEDLMQKTLKTQFEKGLMKRGLRENEVNIIREAQLLDDKRTDFLISYGFVGQILVEIKLTSNIEVNSPGGRTNYKDKLIQYIEGTKSTYGIFLIFQVDDENEWNILKTEVELVYQDVSDKIKIIGDSSLNCVSLDFIELNSIFKNNQ